MNMIELNYLLQKIYTRDYEDFNIFYDFSQNKIKSLANKTYKNVKDKSLYSIEDLTQEIWLKLLLNLNSKQLVIKDINEFDIFLINIIDTVLVEINE